MKPFGIALAALVLAQAGAAFAQDQVSDQDFLAASRCKGLAIGLGADTKAIRRFVNVQSQSRADMILHYSQAETGKAQREAADPARKAALAAELAGPCAPYVGPAAAVAGAGTGHPELSTVR
jgi:hypothetical protein